MARQNRYGVICPVGYEEGVEAAQPEVLCWPAPGASYTVNADGSRTASGITGLDFIGAGVTVHRAGATVQVNVPGGGIVPVNGIANLPSPSLATLPNTYRIQNSGVVSDILVQSGQNSTGGYVYSPVGQPFPQFGLLNKFAPLLPGTQNYWPINDLLGQDTVSSASGVTLTDVLQGKVLTAIYSGGSGADPITAVDSYGLYYSGVSGLAFSGPHSCTGTGDLFMEWFVWINTGGNQILGQIYSPTAGVNGRLMEANAGASSYTNPFGDMYNSAGVAQNVLPSAGSYSLPVIKHVILTINGTSGIMTMYINGVSVATHTFSGTRVSCTGTTVYLAVEYVGSLEYYFSGKIYFFSMGTTDVTSAAASLRYSSVLL